MRRLGSFLPGEGVGGAGAHWNGVTWRWPDHELRIRTKYEERYGKNYIPADMPLQDWGVSGAELEPYYDKFEYVAGISGKAGNIKGVVQKEGNAFEDPRAREYPLPPLIQNHAAQIFTKTAKELGYHPFQRPTANASQPYTNPDGMKIGQCQYCGFCERFGCEANAKGSPNITVIPVALKNPNVELRTYTWVTKVLKDSTGKKATGVQYVNVLTGEEIEQPADLVIIAAYILSNVHLMLLSGIGKPYDPTTGTGVIGKNYAYQAGAGVTLFFDDKSFNPFIATGGWGASIDDFHTNWNFDRDRAWRHRRSLHHRRRLARPSDLLSPAAARHAAMGLGLEARGRQVVSRIVEHQRLGLGDAEPHQLPRSRSDLHQPVRPAADADDVRIPGERAQAGAARGRHHRRHRQGDEPDADEQAGPAHVLERRALSEHAQHRRRRDGHRSQHQCAQPVLPELGRLQRVRDRRVGLPAQLRLQSDRSGRGAGLLDGGCDPRKISQEPGAAGLMLQVIRVLAAAGAVTISLSAAAQDAQRGKALFDQCVACHSFDPARNEAGPHLKGLFGRKAASVGDFVYSPPLRRADFVWTPELVDKFLADPQQPPFRGNRMPFAGMPDAQGARRPDRLSEAGEPVTPAVTPAFSC